MIKEKNMQPNGDIDNLVVLITNQLDDDMVISTLSNYNVKSLRRKDEGQRTLLHIAASMGRNALVLWLVQEGGLSVHQTDEESGWTALHRAAFTGNLHTVHLLIKLGSNVEKRDKDGETYLQLMQHDLPSWATFHERGSNHLHTWGSNNNHHIGHCQVKNTPELVSVNTFSVFMVSISTYHTIILTECGKVFTCGHGLGGRLGHANEESIIHPKLVSTLQKHHVIWVSAGVETSYYVTSQGKVFYSGLEGPQHINTPNPTRVFKPKMLLSENLKNESVTRVYSCKYHTVFLTSQGHVFTQGINGGQLGHGEFDKVVAQPRKVAGLMFNTSKVDIVASCDACVVSLTTQKDVYLLHQFKCRRIMPRQLDAKDVCVSGGVLSKEVMDGGGCDVIVLIITTTGQLHVWSDDGVLRKVVWSVRLGISVKDACLARHKLLFCTTTGEAYTATLPTKLPPVNLEKSQKNRVFDCAQLVVHYHKVACVNAAVFVALDHKAVNYAVLQNNPTSNLWAVPQPKASSFEADLSQLLFSSSMSDVVLQYGDKKQPAHKCVLANSSGYFHRLFFSKTADPCCDDGGGGDNGGCGEKFEVSGGEMFKYILYFMYTGVLPSQSHAAGDSMGGGRRVSWGDSDDGSWRGGGGDFGSWGSSDQGFLLGDSSIRNLKSYASLDANEVAKLQALASKYEVHHLVKMLKMRDCKKTVQNSNHFDLQNMSLSHDVKLVSEDGCVVQAHKAILTTRSLYFSTLFNWNQSRTAKVHLPGNVLEVLISYIYLDRVSLEGIKKEFLCECLVAADLFLLPTLTSLIEVSLAPFVNIKTVMELFSLSLMTNAPQLKKQCLMFMQLNLLTLLEMDSFSALKEEEFKMVSEYYKKHTANMASRQLPAYKEITLPKQRLLSHTKSTSNNNQNNKKRTVSVNEVKDVLVRKDIKDSIQNGDSTESERSEQLISDERDFHGGEGGDSQVDGEVCQGGDVGVCQGVGQGGEDEFPALSLHKESSENTGAGKSNSRKGNRNVKISQKMRKQQSRNCKEEVTSPIPIPTNPWGSPRGDESPSSLTFSQIMQQQMMKTTATSPNNSNNTPTSPKSPSTPFKKLSQQMKKQLQKQQQIQEQKCHVETWKISSPTAEPFSDIIDAQTDMKNNRNRLLSKNLSLVQMEEKAIEELLRHYESPEQQVSVCRVKLKSAAPSWMAVL